MHSLDERDEMNADQRTAELAAILAGAISRLYQRYALVGDQRPSKAETCLEVPGETVLTGHHG